VAEARALVKLFVWKQRRSAKVTLVIDRTAAHKMTISLSNQSLSGQLVIILSSLGLIEIIFLCPTSVRSSLRCSQL
jgi:hypothetical protein